MPNLCGLECGTSARNGERRRRRRGVAVAIVPALLATIGCNHPATGLYTTAQAARGKDVYAGMCLSCHVGMGNHTGAKFREQWNGHSVGELYGFIHDNMPQNDPASLPDADYAAVVAYLLQVNGMAAGAASLPSDTLALAHDTIAVTSATR
jgi:mono/diheme cytochrome c family protein